MMKPTYFVQCAIVLALCLTSTQGISQAYEPDTSFWETKANLLQARAYYPAAAMNGKIYAFGGIIGSTGNFLYTTTIEEYDPILDGWTYKGALPHAMGAMAAVPLNGAIYIIGGSSDVTGATASSKVYRYFPGTGAFDADTIASLPIARSYLAACEAGGKIYAVGGANGWFGTVSNAVYVYDPNLNTWNTGPELNVGRAAHSCAVVGNKIYVLGGTISWLTSLNSMEVLDYSTAGESWTLSDKPLLTARAIHGTAVISDVIYAIGGIESTSSAAMSVEAYAPDIAGGDNWEEINSLPYDRRAFGCVALTNDNADSYIYLIGGNSGSAVVPYTQRLVVKTVGTHETFQLANTILTNSPNPFDQNTTIYFTNDTPAHVAISIFDSKGQLIATPVNRLQAAGEHQVYFDAAGLSPGIYYCVMRNNNKLGFVRKMIVL